jgi:hypothetical protein
VGATALLLAITGAVVVLKIARQLDTGNPNGSHAVLVQEEPRQNVTTHGTDFSYVDEDERQFVVCDVEDDENVVKGILELGDAAQVELVDADGANESCVGVDLRATPRVVTVTTCERNHLWWDCDNSEAHEIEPS